MNCSKCGAPLPATARFCPACAAPVAGNLRAAGGTDQSALEARRRRIAIVGGIGAAVAVAIVAAFMNLNRTQPVAPPTPQPAQASGADSAKVTPAQAAGFDWSGLDPEQLQAARAALDEAIAKEEQTRPGNSKAARPPNGQSAR
ncbi:MAG TPA: zinc ribbon domain-containing protein [Steroidobacteraceae bacterium]|nr:zinc ribbon domain-containing protein [Steroidobacteraceae bacterium]